MKHLDEELTVVRTKARGLRELPVDLMRTKLEDALEVAEKGVRVYKERAEIAQRD